MLWGQDITVFTDHKNLTRDALGLTSDRVYHCWFLLEEYAPEIIYIKGVHNTVADAISRLDYDPKLNKTNEYTHATLGVEPEELSMCQWESFAHHWQSYNEISMPMQVYCFHMNKVLANCSKEDKIYPLTTEEIAKAQRVDASLKHLFKRNAVIDQGLEIKLIENTTCVCKDGQLVIPKPLLEIKLIENTTCVCKDGPLVIPKPLQVYAVKWYHHYLQHPGHTRLEETMNTVMYWKGMRTTIRSLTKTCRSCQINKRRNLKYGHLPPKTIITNPWECLCQPHWSIHS
jgi:hypothetical protein